VKSSKINVINVSHSVTPVRVSHKTDFKTPIEQVDLVLIVIVAHYTLDQ